MPRKHPLTMEEIKALDRPYVIPIEVAHLLGCQPYYLNLSAEAGMLGIAHIRSGNRLKISRAAFLEYCGERGAVK